MSRLIDLTGQSFGFWEVLSQLAEKTKNGQIKWRCRCSCGTEREITSNSLRSCNSTSCGCNHNPNLTGLKFRHLKVIELDVNNKAEGKRHWRCSCRCGNEIIATTNQLKSGLVKSCGCR